MSVRDGVLPGYKEIALKFTAVSPNSRLIDRRRWWWWQPGRLKSSNSV